MCFLLEGVTLLYIEYQRAICCSTAHLKCVFSWQHAHGTFRKRHAAQSAHYLSPGYHWRCLQFASSSNTIHLISKDTSQTWQLAVVPPSLAPQLGDGDRWMFCRETDSVYLGRRELLLLHSGWHIRCLPILLWLNVHMQKNEENNTPSVARARTHTHAPAHRDVPHASHRGSEPFFKSCKSLNGQDALLGYICWALK